MSTSLPQGQVPITINCASPLLADGVYALAVINVPALGLVDALLVLDVPGAVVKLQAKCGCAESVPMAGLVLGLAQTLAAGHGAAPGVTQH